MTKLLQKPRIPWLISAAIAGALLLGSIVLPLWQLELVAPQYPTGLVMHAYGDHFADDPGTYYDDVREINGLNHYIGMAPIEEVTEMKLFIPGVLALAVAAILGSFIAWHGKLARALLIVGFWFVPLFFIADLQYWLYHYGHTMKEDAALNPGAFTPKVFGTTKVWNFHSETSFESGFYLLVLAAVVMTFGPPILERLPKLVGARFNVARGAHATGVSARTAIVVVVSLAAVALAIITMATAAGHAAGEPALTLQQRIDAAAPEDIVVVEGGEYDERIVIDKPVSLVGRGWPILDGGGQGDVLTISADDVVVTGFEVRDSGRAVSQEPAAIKIKDADRVKVNLNRIRESHFGVHVTNSDASEIVDNDIEVGEQVPQERRGHAIYLWEVTDTTVHRNLILSAADGIHLEFAHQNLVVDNTVRDSRYALHLMYSNENSIVENTLTDNLSGAVLMFSHGLIVKDNEMSSNREGATGAGMLLKDTDNIYVQGNRILRNKFGMAIEGAPQSAGATAIFRGNLVALNDIGVGISSNSPITFVENSMIDNIVQIKAMSGNRALSGHGGGMASGETDDGTHAVATGAVWSSEGRGNYWSDYRGFDGNGDGVGDQPYMPRPSFAGRLDDNETLQLFQFTPAQQAIDLASDMFPVYRYDALIEDAHPLMTPPTGGRLEQSDGVNVPLLALSIAMFLAAGLAAVALYGEVGRRAWRGLGRRPLPPLHPNS